MSARIRPQAQHDILELAEELGSLYPATGEAFLRRVNETIQTLTAFPGIGAESPDPAMADSPVRFFPVRRFREYLVAFLPQPNGVEILRLIHGRRDLGEMFDDI